MKTKFIIVVLVFVVILSVALTFLGKKQAETGNVSPLLTPPVEPLSTLPRAPFAASPSGVVFTSSFTGVVPPPTLPVYSLSPSDWSPRQAAAALALSQGLTSSPTVLKTTSGEVLLWSSPTNTITANESDRSLSYVDQSPIQKAQLPTVSDADTGVRKFFDSVGLGSISPFVVIEKSSVVDPRSLPPSRQEGEKRITISYRMVVPGGYPVFTKVSPAPTVVATVGGGGVVRSLLINFQGLPGQKLRDGAPLGLNRAADLLNEGKGELMSYESSDTARQEFSVPPAFSRVTVTSVELGYFAFEKERALSPVYIFSGSANGGSGITFAVRYMLPCF